MAKASATTKTSAPLVRASARQLRIAPRKMRLVTNYIKGMSLSDALTRLEHTHKKAAPILIRLLKSAAANAKNNFLMDIDRLFVKSITTDMGKVMKRYFPRARGSAFVIRRKLSHVNVVLEERKQAKAAKSRLSLFKKKDKEAKKEENIDHTEAVSKKAVLDEGKKPQIFKDEQKVKLNKAQQKRRLFNRKSGE